MWAKAELWHHTQPLLSQGWGRRHQGDEGFSIKKVGNVTSSSSSLSSPGWRGKLLQQQSSVCSDGLGDKLTPGHAEHFLSNASNDMWMGIPKRNPHTAENVTDDSKTSSSNSSYFRVLFLLSWRFLAFGKRPKRAHCPCILHCLVLLSLILFPSTFLVSLSCKYS